MRTLTKSIREREDEIDTEAARKAMLEVGEIAIEQVKELSAPLNLWQKLVEVAARCSYVQKGGVNLFHKYNYVTAADVFEKVSNALHDVGLASWTEAAVYETREKATKSGGIDMMVTVRVTLHVVDPESGQEIATVAYGSGQDAGDKAVMKAQTAALKYAWMMLLNISTGDDPEADEKVDERMSGQKKEKPTARGPAKGDFTAADKELARQEFVDAIDRVAASGGKDVGRIYLPADSAFKEAADASVIGTVGRRKGEMYGNATYSPLIAAEKCELCGNPLGDYTSPKGEYRQCSWAHEERAKTLRAMPNITTEKLAAVTKGHTFKRVAAEPGKAMGGPSTTVAIPPAKTAKSIADEVAGLEGLTSQERIEELSRRINETLQP